MMSRIGMEVRIVLLKFFNYYYYLLVLIVTEIFRPNVEYIYEMCAVGFGMGNFLMLDLRQCYT